MHGTTTNDPGERPRWHTCWECGGTGASPYLNIPENTESDNVERE
jgi:hypothetical protein